MKKFLFFVFVALLPAAFAVSAPIVSSSTHPDPESWYKGSSPSFEFAVEGASGYSYELDLVSDTIPDTVSEGSEGSVTFSGKSGGEWFFHLRAKVGSEWSDTAHFGVKIDRVGPLLPQGVKAVSLEDGSGIRVEWQEATDSLSGISNYKIYRGLLLGFEINDEGVIVVAENVEGTSFVDTTVSEGTYYHYRVQSIDLAGNLGGVSKEAIAKLEGACDLLVSVDGAIGQAFDLNILSDDVLSAATLKVTLPGSDSNTVFSNVYNKNVFYYSFDLSNVPDGTIFVELSAKDSEQDDCSVSKEFFLDGVFPELNWVVPQDQATLSDIAGLSVTATDSGDGASGISSVEFFYGPTLEKIGDGVLSGDVFVFDWNTVAVSNGSYDLLVKTSDRAGNSVEKKIRVVLKNTAIISSETLSQIAAAEEKKGEAIILKEQLDSLGVTSESFDSLFASADSNLWNARAVFEKGINFERAKADALLSAQLFEEAASSVVVSREDSSTFVYSGESISFLLSRNGLKDSFVQEASDNFLAFSPSRRIDIYKITDDNQSFFRAVVLLSFSSNDGQNVKVLEYVPKNFAFSSDELSSVIPFSVLKNDPLLLFDVDLNAVQSVSYVLGKDLSASEVESILLLSEGDFVIPPLVFSGSAEISPGVFSKPVDIFVLSENVFGDVGLFGIVFAALLSVLGISFVLAVVSFVVLALIVLRSRKK